MSTCSIIYSTTSSCYFQDHRDDKMMIANNNMMPRAKSDSAIGHQHHRNNNLLISPTKRHSTVTVLVPAIKKFRWVFDGSNYSSTIPETQCVATENVVNEDSSESASLQECASFFDKNFIAIALSAILLFTGVGDIIVTTFFVSFLSTNDGNFSVYINGKHQGSVQDFKFSRDLLIIALLSICGGICCLCEAAYFINHRFLAHQILDDFKASQKIRALVCFTSVPVFYAIVGAWLYATLPSHLSSMVVSRVAGSPSFSYQKQAQKLYAQMAVELISTCISLQMFKTTLITLLPVPLILYKMGCLRIVDPLKQVSRVIRPRPLPAVPEEEKGMLDVDFRLESRV